MREGKKVLLDTKQAGTEDNGKEKQIENPKIGNTHHHKGCVCMCAFVFSSKVCKLFDLYPLCLYTQQVSWRCVQLADYWCQNQEFTPSIVLESFTSPLTHSHGIVWQTHTSRLPTCSLSLNPQPHLAKHVAWPLISKRRRQGLLLELGSSITCHV